MRHEIHSMCTVEIPMKLGRLTIKRNSPSSSCLNAQHMNEENNSLSSCNKKKDDKLSPCSCLHFFVGCILQKVFHLVKFLATLHCMHACMKVIAKIETNFTLHLTNHQNIVKKQEQRQKEKVICPNCFHLYIVHACTRHMQLAASWLTFTLS